jgi:hypothetical protein
MFDSGLLFDGGWSHSPDCYKEMVLGTNFQLCRRDKIPQGPCCGHRLLSFLESKLADNFLLFLSNSRPIPRSSDHEEKSYLFTPVVAYELPG